MSQPFQENGSTSTEDKVNQFRTGLGMLKLRLEKMADDRWQLKNKGYELQKQKDVMYNRNVLL